MNKFSAAHEKIPREDKTNSLPGHTGNFPQRIEIVAEIGARFVRIDAECEKFAAAGKVQGRIGDGRIIELRFMSGICAATFHHVRRSWLTWRPGEP